MTLFLEYDIGTLSRDVNGHRFYTMRIDTKGKKKDASSVDHRRHDGAFKWIAWSLQGYPIGGAKRLPMIGSEGGLRAPSLKNKETGPIW